MGAYDIRKNPRIGATWLYLGEQNKKIAVAICLLACWRGSIYRNPENHLEFSSVLVLDVLFVSRAPPLCFDLLFFEKKWTTDERVESVSQY